MSVKGKKNASKCIWTVQTQTLATPVIYAGKHVCAYSFELIAEVASYATQEKQITFELFEQL